LSRRLSTSDTILFIIIRIRCLYMSSLLSSANSGDNSSKENWHHQDGTLTTEKALSPVAQTSVYVAKIPERDLRGLACCKKLLLYQNHWRYLYAMLIGYARVSTDDQDTAIQVAALKAAGCERIFREKASGGRWDRPELHRLLDQLRKGDVLVVWKLDRLSRSLRDVLIIMERLAEAKAGFRSLTEAIDTTTPAGRMMMQMVGAFAEFERAMLRERTKAGLDAARADGRIGGRRPKLSLQQQTEIRRMITRGDKTAAYAARLFKIHPATVSRLLARPAVTPAKAAKHVK
jgi:DNA invertase Pin-like site-specific DNA recombinase